MAVLEEVVRKLVRSQTGGPPVTQEDLERLDAAVAEKRRVDERSSDRIREALSELRERWDPAKQ